MSDRPAAPPTPDIRTRRQFSLVWLIPMVAAVVAGFLFWRNASQEGPTITLTFRTAEGLTAGQTKIKHKAVDLGTVNRIDLSPDMSHVVVQVRMRREAGAVLTDRARFWVVRARLTPGSISGLETIVSGSYIELDPGTPDGHAVRQFTGLETPPAVRSDEPGRTFTIKTGRLGQLDTGSLVVYRDITVGEVLGHGPVVPGQPIDVQAFVRAPYDQYVHEGSFFWNDSGLSVGAGAEGLHVQLQSLQAVLAGAVAFDTDQEARKTPVAQTSTAFRLFPDEATATASHYKLHLPFLAHFQGSVRGLAVGAPVELFGIPIGNVTDVHLHFEPNGGTVDVPVSFEVQPERFFSGPPPTQQQLMTDVQRLVDRGLRAQLTSANLLTGQLVVSLDFFTDAPPAKISMEGNTIVLPSQAGDFGSITHALGNVAAKLDAMPLTQIADNVNSTLKALSGLANAPDLRNALQSMASTMSSAQELVKRVDAGLTPALKRLPEIANQLQSASEKVNHLVGSVDNGYGENSQFGRELSRLLTQVNETARSIRLLADFLDQHPEALVRGRTGSTTER